MSLKHIFKSEFLSSQEREELKDLPYDIASFEFCKVLQRFCQKNPIKVSKQLTMLQKLVASCTLFEIFISVEVYNSNKFWDTNKIADLLEGVLKIDLSELNKEIMKRGLEI